MMEVYKDRDGTVEIYMSETEMKELRDEMKSWDGLIELGDVAKMLLSELMELM